MNIECSSKSLSIMELPQHPFEKLVIITGQKYCQQHLMTNIQPVPAATVVLARESEVHPDIEILLLKRNSRLVFHGGHWVFPGGRIDAEDFKRSRGDLEYPAALKAAVR